MTQIDFFSVTYFNSWSSTPYYCYRTEFFQTEDEAISFAERVSKKYDEVNVNSHYKAIFGIDNSLIAYFRDGNRLDD